MSLMDRLTDCLYYLSKESYSNKEIAKRLRVSTLTVVEYRRFLFEICSIHSNLTDEKRELVSLPASKVEIREALERLLIKISESDEKPDDAYFRKLIDEILMQKRYLGLED